MQSAALIPPVHPEGTSKNPNIFDSIQKFRLQFTMVVYEKIYLGE